MEGKQPHKRATYFITYIIDEVNNPFDLGGGGRGQKARREGEWRRGVGGSIWRGMEKMMKWCEV